MLEKEKEERVCCMQKKVSMIIKIKLNRDKVLGSRDVIIFI